MHIIELIMCDRPTESLISLELGESMLIDLLHPLNYVHNLIFYAESFPERNI